MKQSSLWVENEPPSWGSVDGDPIHQLFLGHREPQLGRGSGSSPSTAQPPLEQSCELPAWPKEQLGSRDSSGTSTDSGICLHTPSSSSSCSSSSSSSSSSSFSSSSLSCSAGPEPQGYRQQLPRAEDSGVGLGSPCPAFGCSSGDANPGEPGLSPITQEDVEFRGYLQQSKGSLEPEQAPGMGVSVLGSAESVQGPGSADTVLDMAVTKGYLKQSPQHPLTQDLAPWGAPAWDFSGHLGPQAPTLLSWAELQVLH